MNKQVSRLFFVDGVYPERPKQRLQLGPPSAIAIMRAGYAP